jgi:hypothetical protein
MALFAASVGADGVPALCRAVGLSADESFSRVTIYVPMATSHQLLAAVAASRRLAVVATYPPDHSTTQLKGVTRSVRLAGEEEQPIVREQMRGFVESLHEIGFPYHVPERIRRWPAFAIELDVEEIFEKTPGPNAGSPLR